MNYDSAVYLDVDDDLRFIGRMEHDETERGRTNETILARIADVVIPHGGHNRPAIDLLPGFIRERVALATPGT